MTDRASAYLGIDPGRTGAAAIITPDGYCDVADWPGDPVAAADLLRSWLVEYSVKLCALERVASRPGQGVSSVFRFGVNFGTWQGLLAALAIRYVMPTPQAWQKGIVVLSDGDDPKTRALAVARRLYPDADLSLKKHHGRADALLLANYARTAHHFGI
jgi:crossover junction endodeoxyribonuclease RuvC